MSDPASSLVVAEQVAKLVKAATDVLSTAKPQEAERKSSGVGILQVAGRTYLLLTALLGVSATAASYLDLNYRGHYAYTTMALRVTLIILVLTGALGTLWLVISLARKHVALLLSPADFASNQHLNWLGKGDPVGSPPPTAAAIEEVVGPQ